MFTALLTGIAFIIGAFFERIVFAVMILMLARSIVRRTRRLRLWLASHSASFMARVRFAFGPTAKIVR